jgi:preprotein translocase subunit SecA
LFNYVVAKIFGTKNERDIKRMQPMVAQISALETQMQALGDAELRAKTDEFRTRIQDRLSGIPIAPNRSRTSAARR